MSNNPVPLQRQLRNAASYIWFHLKGWKIALSEWLGGKNQVNGLAVPSPFLRYRVHGALDLHSYLDVGRSCAKEINALLGTIGKSVGDFTSVLDFGCGSGRVLRYYRDLPASCHLFGTDIDAEAIGWCKQHLPFAEWAVNAPMPPTSYANQKFDLVYAISVFTHIDETMQDAWLTELKRITQPGAILLLTVQGEFIYRKLSTQQQSQLAEKGFLYTLVRTGRFKLDGLPDFYQNAFHTRAYVEQHWSRYFTVLKYLERGMSGNQDVVILRNE